MTHKSLTWVRTAPFHQGGDESSCSSLWRHAQRTSCRWGNRCQGPTAGQPLGYPESGCKQSQSRRAACPATLAGSTLSRCSPAKQRWTTFNATVKLIVHFFYICFIFITISTGEHIKLYRDVMSRSCLSHGMFSWALHSEKVSQKVVGGLKGHSLH